MESHGLVQALACSKSIVCQKKDAWATCRGRQGAGQAGLRSARLVSRSDLVMVDSLTKWTGLDF